MTLIDRFRQWRAALAERRIDRLTARAADLADDQPHDLLLLQNRKVVRAHWSGQTITRIHAHVESMIRRPIRVVIAPGTHFVARGNYQNMATTTE